MLKFKKLLFLHLFLLFAQVAVSQQAHKPERIIYLSVKPGLQFSLARFKVSPGEKIKIIFTNTDDMDHNLLITNPGKREEVIRDAQRLGPAGPSLNYIPKSTEILWSIPVLSPGESKSLSFSAPNESGVYPYVCTYPGHGYIMFGAMYVDNGEMPDLKTDQNIPPLRRTDLDLVSELPGHSGHSMETAKPLHPYTPTPPYAYRVFIDGASPAAIAVSLPNNISYCWDAGTCQLRFAWSGGFVDNTELWRGKGDALAKIVGTVFFRERGNFPLTLSPGKIQHVSYQGYKEIDGYPEFHYTVDGFHIYELIQPKLEGNGLVRNFRIPNAPKTVWFSTTVGDNVDYKSSAGIWEQGKLKLSREQVKSFSITMIKKESPSHE